MSIPPPPPPPPPGTPPGGGSASLALEHCYRVYLNDSSQYLGTFLEITGLAAEYQMFEYAEGGNNLYVHHLKGRLHWPNLTLTSGVTNQSVLLDWVLGRGALQGPCNLRIIFTTALGDKPLRTFGFVHAVPVKWTGPKANVGGGAVATETLEIAHHGLTP